MDASIAAALAAGGICDITTTGAKTGRAHRLEIGFVTLGDEHFITGRPGRRRDWLTNLVANPTFTIHLKKGIIADLEAVATEITDDEERADVLYRILTEAWNNEPAKARHILDRWVSGSPLVRFTVNSG